MSSGNPLVDLGLLLLMAAGTVIAVLALIFALTAVRVGVRGTKEQPGSTRHP